MHSNCKYHSATKNALANVAGPGINSIVKLIKYLNFRIAPFVFCQKLLCIILHLAVVVVA
jgi:hypothetical protein